MKKHHRRFLLLAALCLVLCTACAAKEDLPDAASENESRSSTEESAQKAPEGVWRVSKFTQLFPFEYVENYTYDENGLLLQIVTVYGADGRKQTTAFTYDIDQNMLSKITTDKNGTEIAYIRQTFAEGRLMTKTELENGSPREKATVYSYDEQGRLWKAESDETGMTENYIYHENGGYTVNWISLRANGSYLYDASGNLLEMRNGDGELNVENIYDENGRLLTTVQYTAEEATSAYQYEYDADGKLLKREYYSYDDLQQTLVYEYDEYGNRTKVKQVDGGKELLLSETEYEQISN